MRKTLVALSALLSFAVSADHLGLVEKARQTTRLIHEKANTLPESTLIEIEQLLERIDDLVLKGKNDFICVESTQQAGKFCIKSLGGDNYCLGNYFTSQANCNSSLRSVRRGIACYESKDTPGKALIAKVQSNIERIGNYYASLSNCTTSMAVARDKWVCMESESQPGKWLIGDMEKNGDMTGPYLGSQNECLNALSRR